MKTTEFCYWLQGYFEINGEISSDLNKGQVDTIKRHLSMVFKYDIDPSQGSEEHQKSFTNFT